MKIKLIVGLLLGLFMVTAKAEAGSYYTSRSTAVLVSSGPYSGYNFSVIAVAVSSANIPNFNLHYLVLIDTTADQRNGQACTRQYPRDQHLTPPLFFGSSVSVVASGDWGGAQGRSGGYQLYTLPGNGVTVENGLLVCQEGGTAGGDGGTWTVYTENRYKRPE